ncbi:type IV secretion protein Rhs [Erwiniaceae bacterium BAC15a-03b]|uniref:Type IV secretion protein Rhs n=2 Tax=Winslowiella arboricola TaxID=2978220 RepID=A0A9J6PK78_9GAMM|nr:type IV secretion protein Rhs [Winslowiella arboricola]MCU5777778.1 type IV secretion protein Rhs [Winslowiella arboricola]
MLTPGEIGLARRVFGGSVVYAKVWIHCGSYLPFSLQNKNTAMTPNGELYFRDQLYSADFSKENFLLQHLFIHEMAHVWQFQKGMWVKLRGAFSWSVSYSYDLDIAKKLHDYPMEQQAQIIADYFMLAVFGRSAWVSQRGKNVTYTGLPDDNIKSKYETVLSAFFKQR